MQPAQLRPLEPAQLDYCQQLARANMQPYLDRRGAVFDSQRWVENAARSRFFAIYDKGRHLAGFLSLRVDSPEPGNLHIADLQIDPPFQRQGLGSSVLEQCLTLAREFGARAITLNVFNDNPAKGLYLRQGFQPQSTESFAASALEKLHMRHPLAEAATAPGAMVRHLR